MWSLYVILPTWICVWTLLVVAASASFLPKNVAEWAIQEFNRLEEERGKISWHGVDRRASTPFISGDTLRHHAQHICEESNRCRIDPEAIKTGDVIFVQSDFFDFFAKQVTPRIRNPYIVLSHNGDLSTPDGQDDAEIALPRYVTSDILAEEYRKGRLLAHHGQNLWWVNRTFEERPPWLHCLPIGFENRHWSIGRNVKAYADALKSFVINREPLPDSQRPLLLIAFYPKSRVPDRHKVLSVLRVFPPKGVEKMQNPFYNYTDLNHWEWLEAITHHKFVLAPFGHGLDTHRISEILMMGGVPVMRRSTITSCFDDSDNNFMNTTRGSLPIVVVDKWEEVTAERLENEWQRIKQMPPSHWDYRRVFVYHWLERIFASNHTATSMDTRIPHPTYTWPLGEMTSAPSPPLPAMKAFLEQRSGHRQLRGGVEHRNHSTAAFSAL